MKLSNILIEENPGFTSKSMDIKDKLLQIFKFWPLFLVSFVLAITAVWVYVYYAIPYYSVTNSIMLRDVTKGANFLENPVFEGLDEFKSSNTVDNEMDVIQSGLLMNEVVSSLNLYNDYFIENKFKKKEAVFYKDLPFAIDMEEVIAIKSSEPKVMRITEFKKSSFIAEIDDEVIEIDVNKSVSTKYAKFKLAYNENIKLGPLENPILVHFKSSEELAGTFVSQLKVEAKDKFSSVLYLSLFETVPQRGVLVLNELVDQYNLQLSEDKKEVARKSYAFITKQINSVLSDLSVMEQNIESFKSAKNVVNVETDSKVYQENYIRNNREISDLKNQIDIYNSVQSVVSSDIEGDITGLSSLINSDPYLSASMAEYQDAKAKITEYEKSLMPDNPLMIKQVSILNSARRKVVGHIDIKKRQLEITLQNLENENSQFQSKSYSAPKLERQYEEISRDLGIKKEHYLYLIKKREETALFIESVPSNQAKVIDNASFGYVPSKPYPPVLYLAGLFFAFTVPFVYVYGGSLLSNKVIERADLETISQIDVLGEVSYLKKDEVFVINYKDRTPVSEQFRLIRSNFNYKIAKDKSSVILVTSSISGEGKTFFAVNFAKSLSMVGKKVAVLEYDLRKRGLKTELNLKSEKGISNYLSESDFTLENLIEAGSEVNGITVFPVGNIAEDPSEIMYSNKNSLLIERLRENFDYIIIDTAPIGQVSDAFELTNLADYSIFMVRYDYTSKKNLDFFSDIIKNNRLNNPMIVLNGSKNSVAYAYGHYSYN
ncbi:capsular exopolysaccharide synthesis family protein [Algoriphagus sp. 4150]|uniref:GumC family protein n=1 Tax=Algoriphagus sp. 4150 TaxID=2817756 RepID=UPI0028656955|nr:AAA family ATPase [Algoriphagus sp. 4150]MDR7131772.1 capsular exopolysaccharide synthesis family protein [Algoriphagus sp. 4150]